MADTQTPAPTDAELTAIYRAANGEDTGKAQPLTTQRIFRAMRAAIAKCGTQANGFTAPQADSVTAPAATCPTCKAPCTTTVHMRGGEYGWGTTDLERTVYHYAPAQAADRVLEDAARMDWLALAGPTSICVVIDRPHDGEVEVATDDVTGYGKTLREAIDAARKQGGA